MYRNVPFHRKTAKCEQKSVSRDVSDVWAGFVCVCALCVRESRYFLERCLSDLLPFYPEWAFTAALYVLLPKQRPFRTLPHTLPLAKYTFHLACSLQCCLNDSRVVSMATNPCPYKALWRFSTTHPLPSSSVSPLLSHTFTPPPHELFRTHQI